MSCGRCQHKPVPSPTPAPAPLRQIRSGYRAQWNNLALSVETDSDQWTLRVQEGGSKVLYTAYRCGAIVAQRAAAEFAILQMLGHDSRLSADSLVKQLQWNPYW